MSDTWRRTHDWGALTRAEIGAARDAGALPVLTVGSCEQHGDHLPVDTDTVSAYRVSLLAAERCTSPHVLVLPPPSFGVSPHHLAWPGTISLSLATFNGLITDVATSLHRTGFRKLLVVNGHGGNQGPLTAICSDLACRGLAVGWVTYFRPSEKVWTETLPGKLRRVGHACAYETSMQLALRPDEVQRIAGRIDGLPARMDPPWSSDPRAPALQEGGLSWGVIFGPGDVGYAGDPATSTVQAGQAMLELTVAGLAQFFADFAAAELRIGTP
jgi:creatinine amidohydrolase